MGANLADTSIRITVSSDRMMAEAVAPAGFDPRTLDVPTCEAMMRQQGLEINASTRKRLEELIKLELKAGEALRFSIAEAAPAVHGQDGYVEWMVDATSDAPEADDQEQVSFYDKSVFIMVKPGQVMGKVHMPTEGEDGRDVCGKTLVAKAGREAKIKVNETILLDASGQLIAQEEGVLVREGQKAEIDKCIEIPDYVDFSTGNVDFNGDVVIRRGVRDCFIVKATGNVTVSGLIEAAEIITGRDLLALGGFAGRERGTATIGGSLHAKYLDNIQATVLGDLIVDREIINCDLVIHGGIDSPHGALIGGDTIVTGVTHLAAIGSGGNVPTAIHIGAVPRLEPMFHELSTIRNTLQDRSEQLHGEQEMINNLYGNRRLTAQDKERQTELMFEIMTVDGCLEKADGTLEALGQRIASQRTIKLKIERKLFPGVTIHCGGQVFKVHSEIRGPLTILKDRSGALVYQKDDRGGGLLVQVADVSAAA